MFLDGMTVSFFFLAEIQADKKVTIIVVGRKATIENARCALRILYIEYIKELECDNHVRVHKQIHRLKTHTKNWRFIFEDDIELATSARTKEKKLSQRVPRNETQKTLR